MSANSRSEISSSSQDGSKLVASYSNGQRSHFLSPSSLDRLGSFHESHHEICISATGQNLSGLGPLSHSEFSPLSQVLSLDILSMDDHRYARQVELRRAINAAIGTPTEVSSLGTVQAKLLASLGPEELKRVKASVSDCHLKASRERVKFLTEAILKLDTYRHTQSSRKRVRIETTTSEKRSSSVASDRNTSGATLLKSALLSSQNQANSNSVDLGSHRADERNKGVVTNKRVRTAVADVRLEGRLNHANLPRPSGMPDREREFLKPGSSTLIQGEEKDFALPCGKGGWEKMRMKRKRTGFKTDISGPATSNGALDGEREHKLSVQDKPNNDNRVRPSEGHGFRSGAIYGINSTHKQESFVPQNTSNVCTVARSEPDGSSFVNEKKERSVGLDKDRIFLKTNTKPTVHEENQAVNSTVIRKGKASRTPRSSSVVPANSSPRFTRASPTLDGWERPSGTHKVQVAVGSSNNNCPAATRSASPPATQCTGHRSKKNARVTRRVNSASTTNQVDDRSFAEGFTYPDTVTAKGSKSDSHGVLGSGFQGRSPNCSTVPQSRLKNENLNSTTGFVENEHPQGDGESKSVDKNKKSASAEVKFKSAVPGLGTLVLPNKKSKVGSKEGNVDGMHRQGRGGRVLAAGRMGVCQASDRIDTNSNAKLLRSMGPVSEKVESKPSRRLTKKSVSDRKSLTRSRRPVNSGSSDLTGEMEDDHKELLAAVEEALNASDIACSGPYWKEMEPCFRKVTEDDLDFLKQMKGHLEVDASVNVTCSNPEVDFISVATQGSPSPSPTFSSQKTSSTNTENSVLRACSVPLSQRLLSALIIDDDEEQGTTIGDDIQCENFDYMSEVSPLGNCFSIGSVQKGSNQEDPHMAAALKKDINGSLNCPTAFTSSNGHTKYLSGVHNHIDKNEVEHSILHDLEIGISKADLGNADERCILGWQRNQNDLQSDHQANYSLSVILTNEIGYEQMSLDKRIFSELKSIGMFPEPVTDLAREDDDRIENNINKLENEFRQQACKRNTKINKLENVVSKRRPLEERENEGVAMDKLLMRASNRYLGPRGGGFNERSAGSKAAKQAALAFVKRTLDRCQSFDATGTSCFTEPTLKEKLFCIASKETTAKSLEDTTEGETIHVDINTRSTISPANDKPSGDSVVASQNLGRFVVRRTEKKDKGGKEHELCQASASSLEQSVGKDESCSTRTRKKEVLLEHVVGSNTVRDVSVLTSSILGGAKGKRSEREREGKGQNKESIARLNNAKGGLQGLGNVKVERKPKAKPRHKTAQLLKEVNGLLGKPTEEPSKLSSTFANVDEKPSNKDEVTMRSILDSTQDLPCDAEGAIDLSHLPLPGMDDFIDNEAWLNLDDDEMLKDIR